MGAVSISNRAALNRRALKTCYNNNSVPGIRYIKVFFPQPTDGIIQISQILVYSNGVNIAPNGTASAANFLGDDSVINKPIDGILGTIETRDYPEIYHSIQPSNFGYWLLDLGKEFIVDQIVYYNRNGYVDRAIGMAINTYDNNFSVPLNQFILNNGLIQTFSL